MKACHFARIVVIVAHNETLSLARLVVIVAHNETLSLCTPSTHCSAFFIPSFDCYIGPNKHMY